jgi:hypothetical protein
MEAGETITWHSDSSVVRPGWTICAVSHGVSSSPSQALADSLAASITPVLSELSRAMSSASEAVEHVLDVWRETLRYGMPLERIFAALPRLTVPINELLVLEPLAREMVSAHESVSGASKTAIGDDTFARMTRMCEWAEASLSGPLRRPHACQSSSGFRLIT